ncbi:MAG: hypothetical protein AB1716_20920 [Planctomycetota bacterium]
MAVIRRHPTLSVTVVCVLLLAGAGLLLWPRPVAHAQLGYEPLTPVAAARVADLRVSAGLDDDALAAADLSAEQLDSVLPALRSWYEGHEQAWNAAVSAVADQQALIRRLESAIANGRDERQALAAARQTLAQREAELETLVQDLHTSCLGALSAEQRALVVHMRTRRDQPMPFRLLALTAEQDQARARISSDYHQRLALARDRQTAGALTRTYEQQLADALGPTALQKLAALAEYRGAASLRVVYALNQVFPRQ